METQIKLFTLVDDQNEKEVNEFMKTVMVEDVKISAATDSNGFVVTSLVVVYKVDMI